MILSEITALPSKVTSSLLSLRWNKNQKKLFIYMSVFTILLIITKNLRNSYIFHSFSNINNATHEEMTMEDVMFFLQHDLPPTTNWTTFEDSSIGSLSTASLEQPQGQYCVGQTLDVRVDMRNHRGQLKTHGGDFILARVHSPNLQASAAGEVIDLRNGSYRVRFTLFWPGEVQVSILLMHSSEAVQVLWRSRQLNYKKITHKGTFVDGSKVERSECGFQLYSNRSLCENRDKRDAEYYACYTPPTLPCDSIDTMQSFNTPGTTLTNQELLLLHRDNIGVKTNNNFNNLLVNSCSVINPEKITKQPIPRTTHHFPSGYFLKNMWFSTHCQTGNFFSLDSIHQCFKGKRIYFKGDSTVRQWIEYLTNIQQDFTSTRKVHMSSIKFINSQKNYTLQWNNHGYPWIASNKITVRTTPFISEDMNNIGAEEENVVVVISVGQHFRTYPLELFIRRLLSVRRVIRGLQTRNPGAQVFIKLENTRELHPQPGFTERFSDWHGHLQNQAQRMVFRDLGVEFVDAWEMTVAANTFAVHPNPTIVASELAVFLSQLCHDSNQASGIDYNS